MEYEFRIACDSDTVERARRIEQELNHVPDGPANFILVDNAALVVDKVGSRYAATLVTELRVGTLCISVADETILFALQHLRDVLSANFKVIDIDAYK